MPPPQKSQCSEPGDQDQRREPSHLHQVPAFSQWNADSGATLSVQGAAHVHMQPVVDSWCLLNRLLTALVKGVRHTLVTCLPFDCHRERPCLGGVRVRGPRAQPMIMTAANHQTHCKPAAGVEPAVRTELAALDFDFARTHRLKLPGTAHYLMLVRRQYADRAKHSWTCRGITN